MHRHQGASHSQGFRQCTHVQATGAAERFYERVRTPVLTDVEIDFGGLAVEELYPAVVPDLFSAKPVVVKGRYKTAGQGTITLKGNTGEGRLKRKIEVTMPGDNPDNEVLAELGGRHAAPLRLAVAGEVGGAFEIDR